MTTDMRASLAGATFMFALLAFSPGEASAVGGNCSRIDPEFTPNPPTAVTQLGLPDAWQLSRGAGVTVAVVDTGVDPDNPHLGATVLPGTDLVGDSDGRVDTSGRGTALAGQIAAQMLPNSGVIGFAPEAKILPVRVLETEESDTADGVGADPVRTATGIRWAAEAGAQIIVVPHAFESSTDALTTAVRTASDSGALIVAAASNPDANTADTRPVTFPAGYPEAVAVAALTVEGVPSEGKQGVHVELVAPGQEVATTFRDLGDCTLSSDRASAALASGYVGGAAALIAAAHPDETPADWQYRLLATALRPSAAERDPGLGWGIVAPAAALNVVNDGLAPGPPNPHPGRTPAPSKPAMATPPAGGDQAPQRLWTIGWLCGGGVTVMAIAALAAWLWRQPRGSTHPR
ncbi:MAG: S8 family serine peptidase [Propioniciclava sp.]